MSRCLGLALPLVLIASAFGQDQIRDKLDAAKMAYDSACRKANQTVLDRFGEKIKALAVAGKIDESIALKKSMAVFEANGAMTRAPEMRTTFIDSFRQNRAARKVLVGAYEDAIKEYGKALKIEEAAQVKADLENAFPPVQLVSLQVASNRSLFIQGASTEGVVTPAKSEGDRFDATLEIVPGLANKDYVSIRSVALPDCYLGHGDFRLRFHKSKDDMEYKRNTTFKKVPGPVKNSFAFESENYPNHFIRIRGNELWVDKHDGTKDFILSATFLVTDPLLKL